MQIFGFILVFLSFFTPMLSFLLYDARNFLPKYSLKEIFSSYPIFVVVYIGARLGIIFDFQMTMIFANQMSELYSLPGLPFISQIILFIIDATFWFTVGRTEFMKTHVKTATYSIMSLLEATILMFLAMIIPAMAIGVFKVLGSI